MLQIQTDKNTKSLEAQLNEVTGKMEEYMRQVSELNNDKSRFTMENIELSRQLEESESTIMQLNKMKSALTRYVLYRTCHHNVTLSMDAPVPPNWTIIKPRPNRSGVFAKRVGFSLQEPGGGTGFKGGRIPNSS